MAAPDGGCLFVLFFTRRLQGQARTAPRRRSAAALATQLGTAALERPFPLLQLLLGDILLDAVALLDPADQLVALAVDISQIVVGELGPLLLGLALHL